MGISYSLGAGKERPYFFVYMCVYAKPQRRKRGNNYSFINQIFTIMKKIFLFNFALVALFCATVFSACDEPNVKPTVDPSTLDSTALKCWEYTLEENGKTATLYAWSTEKQLVLFIEQQVTEAKKQGATWTYTYKESNETDVDACEERANEGLACWKITVTNGNSSTTSYVFTSEECAELYGSSEAGKNGSYSVEQADAKDPDACDKLNDNQGGTTVDDKEKHCYHVTSGYSINGQTYSSETYVWATEADMKMTQSAFIASMENASYEYELTTEATEDACLHHGFACYQINGPGYTMYSWTTEQILQNLYGSNSAITWQLADPTDEDSCNALNY